MGRLTDLELVEMDLTQPPLPRPGEDRMGALAIRAVTPLADGRGWRITVQPLGTGMAILPPMDLGDGRRTPELRIPVPRTVPFGDPWMGVGGGQADRLPRIPFPWAWGSLLALPLLALGGLLLSRWRGGARGRALRRARHAFRHAWPPARGDRDTLDAVHLAGRTLLAARFGNVARSWGEAECRAAGAPHWGQWIDSLDSARFARQSPPLPPLEALLQDLEGPPC
jgi:hypothetical protein